MRLSLALACLLLVGCVGPHSTGSLWAQQNLDNELRMSRQSEAQRADLAHAFELSLADGSLASERARIGLALEDCPGAVRQPLVVSSGDRVRDAIRLRLGNDAQRQAMVAQVALADWRLRRAQATGEAHFCAEARQALGGLSRTEPSASNALAGLGSATVARDPQHLAVRADASDTPTSLSNYALGYVDALRAPAPLPQYLAAVYGGVLVNVDRPLSLNIWVPSPGENARTPEGAVDLLTPVYPQWEPDAIYIALSAL